MASAAACLGLGAVDLALLNLKLVPAALSAGPSAETSATLEVGASRPGRAAPQAIVDEEPEAIADEGAGAGDALAVDGEARAPDEGRIVLRFGTGAADLDASARRALAPLVRRLERDDRLIVRVEGHADERGSSRFNATLGRQRAEAVASHLAGRGIARGRIAVRSFGEERPLVRGRDEATLRRNRRVEVAVERGTR